MAKKTERYKNIAARLEEYTASTELPSVLDFAYQNGLTKNYLYELAKKDQEIADSIKRCGERKQYLLEVGGLTGKYNPSVVIFSLKQFGWTDHAEPEQDDTKIKEVVAALNRIAGNESGEEAKSNLSQGKPAKGKQ